MALVSVAQLAGRIGDPDLRVVDVRWYLGRPGAGREAYEVGHIPTAIFLDLDSDLADPDGYGAPGRHPLPSPSAFRHRLERAGISGGDEVVAYDDVGGQNAARLWWMLDNLGHARAAVLDGGIQAWIAAGHQLGTDVPEPAPGQLTLADAWRGVIDREQLAQRLADLTLLDVRAAERYRGEIEPIDPAAGHIPTAISLPTSGNLAADGGFAPAEDLRARFSALAASGRPVVASCGSGVTACHTALAIRVAGLPDAIVYVGSFSDWSRSGMPVATGPEPGEAPQPEEPPERQTS